MGIAMDPCSGNELGDWEGRQGALAAPLPCLPPHTYILMRCFKQERGGRGVGVEGTEHGIVSQSGDGHFQATDL